MKQKYQVWWTDDQGRRIQQLDDFAFLNYSRIVNGIGTCNIGLPYRKYGNIWREDYRLEVYRRPSLSDKFRLENIFFMLEPIIRTRMEDNVTILDMSGHDGMTILDRRIVKHKATTTQSRKRQPIDDMMKEIVDEQMGAAAYAEDADRAIPYNLGYFQIQSDVSAGRTVWKTFAYRNVLDVLKELSRMSRIKTPKIYFDVVPISATVFEFRTYLGQRGQDRRFSVGKSAFYFSLDRGNLEGPSYEFDTFDEKNVAFVGGQGENKKRDLVERENTDRSKKSVWARRELFVDARQVDKGNITALEDAGDQALGESVPNQRFVANFLDAPGTRYGVDWDYGDLVTASYAGIQFDCEIKQVQVTLEDSGAEKIFGRNEFGNFGDL